MASGGTWWCSERDETRQRIGVGAASSSKFTRREGRTHRNAATRFHGEGKRGKVALLETNLIEGTPAYFVL